MHHARGISKTHFPQKVTEFRTPLDLRILPVDTGYTCGGHDSITQQHQHKEMYSIPLRYKERGGKTLRTVYTDLPTGSPTPNHCKEQFMQRHKSQCCSMESKHYYLRRLWEPWMQLAVAALGMSRMHKWVGLFLSFFFFNTVVDSKDASFPNGLCQDSSSILVPPPNSHISFKRHC